MVLSSHRHPSPTQSKAEVTVSAALSAALCAVAAHPERQVIQSQPTPVLMVAYFKKYLQRHMTATGVAGTEDLSLSAALCALEEQRPRCTFNADDLVAKAMEELRQEAKCGEKRSAKELAWSLSYAIAEQHMHERML